MSGNLLNKEDMVNNPTIRVPVCLCLDTSGSMDGNPIKELNDGVKLFFDSIKEDEAAVYSAEICIVTFGDKGARCIRDFAGVYAYDEIPKMKADGYTPMGEAVNIGLNKLEEMKQLYKAKGIDYYQPWLVLMTDGRPNGDPAELEKAIQKTVQLVGDKKLTVFPIGIGNEADMNTLARFSPLRAPLKLKGLRFKEFFAWLSQSVSRVSQSALGESVMLDTAGIQGWGELQWGIIMDMSNFSMKDINPFGSKNIAAEHRKLTDEEQLSISNVVYEKVMFELKNNINQMLPQIVQSITDEVTQKFQEEINRLKQRINDLESRNANLSAQSVSIVSKNTKTVLSEDEMNDIDFFGFHVNGWIYYQNERQGNFLYKVREDGTENIQLTDYSIYSNHFTVKDGYLYFNTDAFNTSKIKL